MSTPNKFLTGFKKGMRGFSHNITTIVNTVLLSLVYFIGVGITSIAAKIVRKRFLDMKVSETNTYWTDLNLKKRGIEEYYRQF